MSWCSVQDANHRIVTKKLFALVQLERNESSENQEPATRLNLPAEQQRQQRLQNQECLRLFPEFTLCFLRTCTRSVSKLTSSSRAADGGAVSVSALNVAATVNGLNLILVCT